MTEGEFRYATICQAGTTILKNGKETKLHPYQQKAKSDIFKAWDEVHHVMLQMPTGTGKTYLFSSIIHDINDWSMKTHTPNKMLVIAHRKELIDQIDKSLGVFHVAHSVLAGPKEQRNLSNPVIVSSIQTITHPANEGEMERLRSRIHFVIIDEAHHAMANTYRKLWKMFPEARFLGVTATPWRMNHSGFRRIFDRLILTQSVKKCISQGYLAQYNYYSLKPNSWVQGAIDGIHNFDKWGDYDEHALIDTMDLGHIRAQLVKSYQKYAWKKKGIIYSINKQHSANICNDYRGLGVRIVDIDDSTPSALRKQYVDEFKEGKIDIIVNVNIFSEGFDCPDIEFIQLARPTRSLTMYLQQVGRGLRITEGKSKCIILDNVGMYSRFGLPDANRHWMAHFRGQDVDESPKKGNGFGMGNGYYDEPDLSEGDEEMLIIQETEAGIESDDTDFIKPISNEEETPEPEVISERIKPKHAHPQELSRKLKTISPMKPTILLESNHFYDGYSIVADNNFYFIKVQSSGNCYFIAPVFRKPSETDELIVESIGDSYVVKHLIPEAEKAKEQNIGSILIDEDTITFLKVFNGRSISTSFKVT
jgi:superfamily II DNA or RNA helicase